MPGAIGRGGPFGPPKMMGLCFHTEKLHDDAVWQRVERVARRMAKRGMKATFFIYPLWAQAAGKDISERVLALAVMGHEIGQHTHFYAGIVGYHNTEIADKVNDFRDTNIRHCIQRDYETLRQMGVTLKGFTAGGWVVNEVVWHTLIELGFIYDCSALFPKPKGKSSSSFHQWLSGPKGYDNTKGRLLLLPTTCSLGEYFKWGWRIRMEGETPYQLVYLHDHDLLSVKTYGLLWSLIIIGKWAKFTGSGALAELICSSEGTRHD